MLDVSTNSSAYVCWFFFLGKSKEKSVVKNPPIYHDKDVNTYISVKPDAQIWPAYSFPAPGQIPWGKDLGNFGKRMETRAKEDLSWSERRDSQCNIDGLAANNLTTQGRINPIAASNVLEYEISRKKQRIDDENEEIQVVSPSISPRSTSTESPIASNQVSPSQVFPKFLKNINFAILQFFQRR